MKRNEKPSLEETVVVTNVARAKRTSRRAKADDGVDVATEKSPTFRPKTRLKQAPSALIVGGEPRVDLLPPEVKAERKARRTRRALAYAVAGVAALVVIAVGSASLLSMGAQAQLNSAESQTSSLLAQQKHFQKARTIRQEVGLIQAAQQVGASTEIDWTRYLQQVQQTLPGDVSIAAVSVGSENPLAAYQQSTAPLQGARVATLTFTANSPELPAVPTWLKSLSALPGFADATPGSVSLDTTTNIYTVTITMHINSTAFDARFTTKEK
jgi:hypothetical protein